MSKRSTKSSALRWNSIWFLAALLFAMPLVSGCDRGASEQEQAALNFADAIARNDHAKRDSLIATPKFKEYFRNDYVASDMLSWFHEFYDYKTRQFTKKPHVDVDRDLTKDLEGALFDTAKIEESGMVIVPSPTDGDQPAVFWMVKQRGKVWRVAFVTRGETALNVQ